MITTNTAFSAYPITDAVFRPFRRLNHRDAYPGSGMGLTVAQVLTGRQGGQITLHGSDEGGTRVIVWLEESRT